MFLGEAAECFFEFIWPHVRGRCVDQIAGQCLAHSNCRDAGSVDGIGRDQAGGVR